MKLIQLSGQILNIVTKTELLEWTRWVVFIGFIILFFRWFSGILGF